MGEDKKFKKEREKRKGKNKKLQKEEMAWLTENTRFDKSNINAWHKVRRLLQKNFALREFTQS